MPKLTLNPSPTFKAKVDIHVPGVGNAPVEFTFKHRTKPELDKWLADVAAKTPSDPEALLDCVLGWDLDDEFNAENVKRFCDTYHSGAYAVVSAYRAELRGNRAKN